MVIAVKGRSKTEFCAGIVRSADGFPALAAVPVGITGVSYAVAVGVKVQVGHQLVADTSSGTAAHAMNGIDECLGVHDIVLVGHIAIAVSVVADDVQLVKGCYFDQPVVVGIVIAYGHGKSIDGDAPRISEPIGRFAVIFGLPAHEEQVIKSGR